MSGWGFRKGKKPSVTQEARPDPNLSSLKEPEPAPYETSNLPQGFFASFPTDVFIKVLGHLRLGDLTRCCCVSTRWKSVAESPELDPEVVDLRPFLRLRSAETALRVLRQRNSRQRGVHLGHLCLTREHPLGSFLDVLSPKLTFLSVDAVVGKKYVTSACVTAIARKCTELQSLDLFGCWCIGDEVLEALAKHCPLLRCLNLASCPDISDQGLGMLSKGCNKLEELNLWRCFQVTDKSLERLGNHCRQLKVLNLGELKYVTSFGLQFFKPETSIYC